MTRAELLLYTARFAEAGQAILDMAGELDMAVAEVTPLREAVSALNIENDALKARIAELEAEPPPDEPPPAERGTLIGISGTGKINGACERWFDGAAGITKAAPRRSKALCPRIHCSWKVLGDPVPTDAQIIAAFKNLLDGDKVEVEHEADVKYRKDVKANAANAASTLAARLKAKDLFHDQVKRLREAGKIPKVDTVNTYSAWSFALNGPKDASKYICKADVLGADLDGDDATVGGYAPYGDPGWLGAIVAFADAHYGGRWTVPEHGWNNTVVGQRIPHFKQTIPAIAEFNPEEIQVFDASGWSPLLTAAELAELTVIVKQYNSPVA